MPKARQGAVKIIPPSPEIAKVQGEYLHELRVLLPDATVELIGGMSVPMAGREEVDIMVVTDDQAKAVEVMLLNGYPGGVEEKGVYYLTDFKKEVECGIQILSPDHPQVETNRRIRSRLQEDASLRQRLERFKKSIEKLTQAQYKEQKSVWIRDNILNL